MAKRRKHKPLDTVREVARDPDVRGAVAGAAIGAAAIKVGLDRRAAQLAEQREFALHEGEPLPEGLARIARGQIDETTELLEPGKTALSEKAVHESRKSLKRLRAMARLARGALGAQRFERENSTLRDAGRRLAGARDAEVMVDTLEDLLAHDRDGMVPGSFERLRAELLAERRAAAQRLLSDAGAAGSVVSDLRQLRERAAHWLEPGAGFDGVEPGLRRIYRQGRRRHRLARSHPTDENLHDWRKRVKDLRHAAEVLAPADAKRMRRIAKRADRLGELLGADHDLAVLGDLIAARHELIAEADREAIGAVIAHRRTRLKRKAMKLGRKLYADRTSRFTGRIARDWSAQVR